MKIDKKSLIRAAVLSAILGLNGVTAMGGEDRPRGVSRWDINNPQNDNTTKMVEMDEMDELVECSICFVPKKKEKVLKTFCCRHDICEECIKNIQEMAREGSGYRTPNKCPFCRNDEFEKWGKLVKKVVKPEKDEDNTNLVLSDVEKQKINLMDSKKRKAVIDSLQAAAAARSQQNDLLEKIATQKEKGSVDPELEKELKLQREIEKNNRDAVAWDLENAAVRAVSDKTSGSNYSSDQKSSDAANRAALEQAILIARRDTYNETLKYGRDVNKVGHDLVNMERALAVLNGKENEKANCAEVAKPNIPQRYVTQNPSNSNFNNQSMMGQQPYQNQVMQRQAMQAYQNQVMQRQAMQAYQNQVMMQAYQNQVMQPQAMMYRQPMMY